MPIFKVNIKWQKEKFNSIECDTDESPDVFKALIFSLTGIVPDRQKIMMPGGTLKSSWSGIRLKDGITIMVMGTAEELHNCNVEIVQPKFAEDMTEGEINRALKLPQGLINIGNTCYMNATIQCLRSIPELNTAMKLISGTTTNSGDPQKTFVVHLGRLFQSMESASAAVTPMLVLNLLHQICPQFSSTQQLTPEQGGGSILMQQDANECWTEIVRCLNKSLEILPNSLQNTSDIPASFGNSGGWNFVDRFMTGRLDVTTINSENEIEKFVSVEPFLQLSCFIDKDVKYLQTGLRSGLEGTLTKLSESLGRDALFKRSSKVARLPAYLSVQFVRFYYKEKEKINAKVLKDVKFPLELDMYEFCNEDLQKSLLPMRDQFRLAEDRRATAEKEKKPAIDKKETEARPQQPYWFADDVGSNNSGLYELRAVLTHQGRSSSSGHYLGWVRHHGDLWHKYDDDSVSEVASEDILRLSGGGDWHCAYLLMYGPRTVPEVANGDCQPAQ